MRPSRHDERLERLQLGVAVVDGMLEITDAAFIDARLRQVLLHLLAVGCREQRSDREEIALNWNEHFIDTRHWFRRAREAQDGVQLVDVPVRFHARVVLRNAAAAE